MLYIRTTIWPSHSINFLKKLWSCHPPKGHVFLGTRSRLTGAWGEHAFDLSKKLALTAFFKQFARTEYDLYFCPNRFRLPKRQKSHALPTSFAWSDIDRGDPSRCRPRPKIVLETSPGRFQALWLWDDQETPRQAELFSKTLTNMANGDRNCWSVTKYLRIVGAYNHKPEYERPTVRLNASPGEIRLVLHNNSYFVSKYGLSKQHLYREVDRILKKLPVRT